MRRKLGQHFLKDQEIIARIFDVAGITPADVVLEIGPGKGVLTYSLAEQANRLVAIEYDPALAEHLQQQFAEQAHVRILHADARHVDYEELTSHFGPLRQRIKIIANLPYYAAVPIMVSLVRASHLFCQCTLMFQKEVAERITAKPGTKAYGFLSVLAQYYSEPRYCFSVPPQAFHPRPKVDSAVIRLQIFDTPPIQVLDEEHFFQLVKYAFLTRRKTLKNSLAKNRAGIFPLNLLQSAFETLNFHEHLRGEELTLEEFANLSNEVVRLQRCRETNVV